jgi:predicted dehydrogenase
MKLRVGLVGLGEAWQHRHRPALRVLQDRFEVRAVYGSVPLLADQAAREFRCDRVDGFRSLIQRPDIDAVLILEHSWQGWLPMLAACDAGKAIYWAADLDLEPDQAIELKQRVDRSGVAFMAEFPRRYAPATLRLKELIATRLGPPQLVFCHRRVPGEDPVQARHGRPSSPGHLIARELVELIDWCRFTVGVDPQSTMSVIHHNAQDHPDYQVINLQFPQTDRQPVTCQLSCGRYIPSRWTEAITFRPPAGLQICCERGLAFIDLPSSLVWFDDAGRHQESLESELSVGEQLLTQFHRAVTSLVRKMSDLEDAYRALRILQAAQQSAAENRRVDIIY